MSLDAPTTSDVGADAAGSAVQVAVRVRPLSAGEAAQGSEPCVNVLGDTTVLVGGIHGKQYDFDAAFGTGSQQHELYASLVAPMVDRFFDGYNATVFAYGQTGSGKTFTMGNEFKLSVEPGERGIIPRTMDEIFRRSASASTGADTDVNKKYALKVSYLEILNEEIRDLLAPSSSTTASLSVRDDGRRGICVNGLSEHSVHSLEEVAQLLNAGTLNRATASTNMNAQSSRSHAICTLTMEQFETTMERGVSATFSKFHLVDLAGSERAKRTNAEGARFKEGVNINKGLLSLGNVINALSEKSSHVPYRDSKLTRLLQDSLGGNSKTLMIACVSPADVNFEETCNTLRYASRARNIQNQAVINQTISAENQMQYLKQQLEVMQLQLLQNGKSQPSATHCTTSAEVQILEKEIQRWKSIAKTREEELQLVMNAKDKWKRIADEVMEKKKSGLSGGASRINSSTGDCCTPKSKAMLRDAIEFDKSVSITEFPSTPNIAESQEHNCDGQWAPDDVDSLEEIIKEKEKIVQALSQATNGVNGDGPLTALSLSYEQKICDLEQEVKQLTREKQVLAQQSTPTHASGSGSMPSDAQSNRLHTQLQNLQNQLHVARHAEKECKRLTRLWKTGSLKIGNLEREIVEMKKQKTALQRRLKEEAEAHRKEKREQDLKILQLKRQDQRKQYEIQKLTSLHSKQSTVLKRKNEEIAAANKRMKTLVQQQQNAQQQRALAKKRLSSAPNRVGIRDQQQNDASDSVEMLASSKLVTETLDIHMTIAGARSAIQMELDDRKKVALKITQLESRNDPSTRSELEELKATLKGKNADIRLLQQKLASVEKNATLPPGILPSKISVCHQLIKQLMETLIEAKTNSLEVDNCKADLQAAEEELVEQAHRYGKEIEVLKKQLNNGTSTSETAQVLKLREELDRLRSELDETRRQAAASVDSSFRGVKKKAQKKKSTDERVDIVELLSSSEDEDVEEDDDSDYVEEDIEDVNVQVSKNHARHAAKKRQPLKSQRTARTINVMDEIDELLAKPSAVAGNICCSCNGKCATKSCVCRSEKQECGPECSCKESKCHNRGDVQVKTIPKKQRRMDHLSDDKENEVESFFDLSSKETGAGLSDKSEPNQVMRDEESKFKKLWSGGNGISSSTLTKQAPFAKTPAQSYVGFSQVGKSSIARFF